MAETPAVITLVGYSGVGKTTLMRRLVEGDPHFQLLRSVTTRQPRDSDIAHEYRYLTPEEYEADYQSGHFLWDMAAGNKGDRYAKDMRDVTAALGDGEHAYINALIPPAAEILMRRFGAELIRTVWLASPGDDELRRRLLSRGDDPAKIDERLTKEHQEGWEEQTLAIEGLRVIKTQDLIERSAQIYDLLRQ